MPLPIIYTPITKLQIHWDGMQNGPCGMQYMDFMRCASRIGFAKARYECKRELDDFHECVMGSKQEKRRILMQKERKRQARDYVKPLGKDIPEQGY